MSSEQNLIKERDIDHQCTTLLEETCLSVLKQGTNRGLRCWRPPTENGYCGKHQTDATIEKGILEGLQKCLTHRCTKMIKDSKYCEECIEKKEKTRLANSMCKGKITQGPKKGEPCDKKSSTPEGYCGKHTLNIIVNAATEEGKRICDDGKRACKNFTIEGKLKCEECLAKERVKDKERYDGIREHGLCLGCGCEIEIPTEGFRKEEIQRCEDCYEKLKVVESRRERPLRNFKEERKSNIIVYYKQYQESAKKRNLEFSLDIETFIKLVSSECRYCGSIIELEVNGIDRVDSSVGYIQDNIVTCCSSCNKMKMELSISAFESQIEKIYKYLKENPLLSNDYSGYNRKSYIRPREIVNLYKTKKLSNYIQTCLEDKRSPSFIEKMKDLSILDLNEIEARAYIKNALKLESNIISNSTSRQRINRKEMFGHLKNKDIESCIKHYNYVHGTPDGLREDIEFLITYWNDDDNSKNLEQFNSIIIKYQNKRNQI